MPSREKQAKVTLFMMPQDCAEGLGKTSGHGCETCLPTAANALRLTGVMGCVSLMIILFIRATIKSALAAKSDLSTIGKIGFSFLQFNSMALQFDYEFPPMVETFLKIQEQPATIANGVMSVDCFVKDVPSMAISSVYVKSLCYLAAPFMIALVCRVAFCKYRFKKLTHHPVDKGPNRTPRKIQNLSTLSRMNTKDLPHDSKARLYVTSWNHYITAFIITFFMIHPSIVQMTFAMFNCKKLGANDDDWYLIEDMNVSCRTSTYFVVLFTVAVPMMIFYVWGLPLFVLWRLYRNRDELTKKFDQIKPGKSQSLYCLLCLADFATWSFVCTFNIYSDIINRYHFLSKGYEEKFYYWEIIIMFRKILMVAIAVFFSYDIQIQSLLATLLVVVVLCVHSLACPYINEALDGLELLSLFGSFCTYFFGQFLFAEAVGPVGKAIVSFIIVAVNLCVVVAICVMVAGKGVTAVAAFGRKFRAIICCQKKNVETSEVLNI